MMCSEVYRIRMMLLIALAISLSNTFYAQSGLTRPYNDECTEAIILSIAPQSTYDEFSMEGAGRSANLLNTLCEEEMASKNDVWFTVRMPENGSLNVFLKSKGGCPAIAVYKGNCNGMTYLSCDASKANDTEKSISIRETALANSEIMIPVFSMNTFSSNVFEIKAETNPSTAVAVGPLSANTSDQGIQINWITNAETQVFYTLLQHSTDAVHYNNISSFKGRNNNAAEQYTFMHQKPQVGNNHYRLVLVHDNGEQTISNELTIQVDKFNATVRVYPNPASERVTLQMPNWVATSPAKLVFLNMLGQQVKDIPLMINPGGNVNIDFQQHQLASGVYYLHLVQNDQLIMNHQLSIQY